MTSKGAIVSVVEDLEAALRVFFFSLYTEMEAELNLKTSSSHDYLAFFLYSIISLYFLRLLWAAYGSPLRSIPGPIVARFTPLWLFYKTAQFKSTTDYKKWHEQYGPMVRVSPTKVSCADPAMIPVIYKIGSRFQKVCAGGFRRCIF